MLLKSPGRSREGDHGEITGGKSQRKSPASVSTWINKLQLVSITVHFDITLPYTEWIRITYQRCCVSVCTRELRLIGSCHSTNTWPDRTLRSVKRDMPTCMEAPAPTTTLFLTG